MLHILAKLIVSYDVSVSRVLTFENIEYQA